MDAVVGSYILSYPKNLEEAASYCKAIASHLKKEGIFVGFNNNLLNHPTIVATILSMALKKK